ncbi:MAG: family 10 glycosylhydrolase, partial [Thermoguttaceae bacterium]
APAEKIRLIAQLKNPYAEKPVWQSEIKPIWESEQTVAAGEGKTLAWEVPLDVQEGVYQLTVTATQPGWLSLPQVESTLVGSRIHASRMIELVVLSPERPKVPTGTLDELKLLKLVEEIDPTHPEWWKRFANLPQLPRLRRLWNGPLGNQHSERVQHPSLGPLVRLEPNGGREDLSWEAYTIPIREPGRPHLLQVFYPSDSPQTFGVSIVEPNSTGAAQLYNLDTGVDQFEEVVSANEPAAWREHRVIFWPKTKTPIVLVTNRRHDDPAFYGAIRVSSIGDHLPRAFPPGGPTPGRLYAAYLDRPLFPESFSAEEVFVASSQLGMDDWRTFYQGGTRLVEYLNHVGYGGLFLSIYADGSTIYPSRILEPTTRYDTGAYLETGQDPQRKDVVEMMLRLFDREGLKLIPSLEFATPLPALEAALRKGGHETQGMEWVGRDGRTWSEVNQSYRGRAPYYNVLDQRVQEAMLDVVRELVERYSHHPSFAGVAIQLSADGYAQLPARSLDSAWGLDDVTVARFQQATGIKLSGEGANRFDERFRQLAAPQVEAGWLSWRAEQVADFYRRVYQELTTRRPDTRLYLAGARMFEGDAMQQQLRPSLPRRLTLDRTMKQVGIDPQLYADPQGPVLLFGETVLPWTSLAGQSVSLELDSMRKAEDLASSYGATGTLFYHQPQEASLASFDRLSPFQPSLTRLTTQAVPSAAQNRRRLVRALAQFDPTIAVDGSLRVPLGQEDSLRDLILLYRQLPAARFITTSAQVTSEPLTVRYLQQADATYVLVVNEAGFPVTASIRFRMPKGCRLEELTGMRQFAPLRADGDATCWDVRLDPYDAIGGWIPSRQVEITKASARWSPEIDRALEARVDELESRRVTLSRSREWGALENPGFEAEMPEPGQIPGWMFRRGSEANVQVDGAQARTGHASLRMVSQDQPTSVMSLPFKAPRTGRLTIKMWVRSSNSSAAGQPLQIGVLGVHRGRTYHCAAVVPAVGSEWSQVGVDVPDVPDEGLHELQLHFQLTGPGEIWIDDVQLEDLAFRPQEQLALV